MTSRISAICNGIQSYVWTRRQSLRMFVVPSGDQARIETSDDHVRIRQSKTDEEKAAAPESGNSRTPDA
ncbi:hypothetical protein GCM10017752_11510 [Streptomyces roseoviridis]